MRNLQVDSCRPVNVVLILRNLVYFFDLNVTRNDNRIINWLLKSMRNANIQSQQDWLRPLTKLMNQEFKGIDTTVLTDDEIHNKLNIIVNKLRDGG